MSTEARSGGAMGMFWENMGIMNIWGTNGDFVIIEVFVVLHAFLIGQTCCTTSLWAEQ